LSLRRAELAMSGVLIATGVLVCHCT